MAERPLYIPIEEPPFFKVQSIAFKWFPGYSVTQKQKSIESLHQNACSQIEPIENPLEISSKSTEQLGHQLSAFHLPAYSKEERYQDPPCSLETMFQTSKVFGEDVHCIDLLGNDHRAVRKQIRERENQGLKCFRLEDVDWPLDPRGAFYNFIYLRSFNERKDLHADILRHDGFTDIEFNPRKSINCQAEAVSVFVGLSEAGHSLDEVCANKESFLETVYPSKPAQETKVDPPADYQEEMPLEEAMDSIDS